MSSKMAQLLNEKMVDFKSIIIKTEPVDYRSDDNEYGDTKDDAIINTEIVLNNVDVVKRELNDEENDYEAFDVNTTEPEDSTDDQGDDPHLDVDIDEKPGKNTIGKKLLIFLVKSKLETAKQDRSALFWRFFFLLKIVNFYCSKIVTL